MQVTFEGSEPWQAARSLIDREVERLEKHNCHIIGCRVAVIAPSRVGSRSLAFSGHAMRKFRIRSIRDAVAGLQKIIVFAFAIASGIWGCLSASLAADANRGQELVGAWCVACHVPLEERKPGNLAAPSFETIAERSVLDVKSLSQQLLAPHPQMPDRALSRDEAADIATYILSLRK